MNSIIKFFFTPVLFIACSCSVFSGTIYVDASASGSNDGGSWANAHTDLQQALSLAIIGDDVWVANGVYYPSQLNDREVSFVMKNGVNLYGGFSGTESSIDERDLSSAATSLSGDIGQPGDNTDNTKQIVVIQNFTADFIFDGFRVINGFDTGGGGKGAAMYMDNNPGSDIEIRNCLFYNNFAYHSGGALWIRDCVVQFSNCEFLYNSTFNNGGGAIYSANGSDSYIDIVDCVFTGNDAREGSVIKFSGFELLMDRCLISNNTATSGDIINIDTNPDLVTISNSVLVGNLMTHADGCVISSYTSPANSTNLINLTICHNKNTSSIGPYGTTVRKINSPLNAYNCIIYGNTDSDDGVQIHSDENVSHSIIEHGFTNGTAIIGGAPLFVNAGSLEEAPFDATDMDYSLADGSLGINSGSNPLVSDYGLDYNRMARVQQGTADIGAIESNYLDTTEPSAICQDIELSLDNSGSALLTPEMVDNGSFDLGGIAFMSVDLETFDCNTIGENTVTLEVTDNSGLIGTCTSAVTVVDILGPTAILQGGELYLGPDNTAILTPAAVDNGSYDNCGLVEISIPDNQFDCADIGTQTVEVLLVDSYGNLTLAEVNIEIIDSVAPVALAQALEVYLNSNGEVSISPEQVDMGSSDNCSIAEYAIDIDLWDCVTLGSHDVTLSVTDYGGNASIATTTITVLDTISPSVSGQNITIDLAIVQPFVITPSDLDMGSNDNCTMSLSINQDSFDTTGEFSVLLTATDGSGNVSSETYIVTVVNSVGIEEWTTTELFIVPNPAQDKCVIEGDLPTTGRIDIVDMQSKIVRSYVLSSLRDQRNELDLQGLSTGMYALRLSSEKGHFSLGQLIKIN